MQTNTASRKKHIAVATVADRATLTAQELADLLGVSLVMVYRMLKDGEIPRRRAGRKYIIPRSAVEDWLRNTPATRSRRAS